ncbi:hypothetical protein CKO25_08685 [Thiocapsa imhoffii]|uniref:Uncharacterized protein n=1 Tax=Thiocapsa imhoffii TaxID=382777 RepID=A0A9X1B965_9GAMM|nr:hypothetical protein [Thiocapsa imhoffii]MBK1644721.1 hypothetical protein [Thiocapsa imhoffii]
MNDTLRKIKERASRTQSSVALEQDASLASVRRRHQAAWPLLQAFAEIQDHFVKIDVLKRIWPTDYDRRPDRAHGLVIAYLGGDEAPFGLMLRIPAGTRVFEVQETWDGRLLYVSARETDGARPLSWQYDTPEPWLDGF